MFGRCPPTYCPEPYNKIMMKTLNTMLSAPTVTFLGAAQTVTGSMHLVEAGDQRLLLDCGQSRSSRQENRDRNGQFPFDPLAIDAVILSHAHIDHCGNLPCLVKQGYQGPIYCTAATRDLIEVMLRDSARIQEEEAGVSHGGGRPRTVPLYNRSDVHAVIDQCVVVAYNQEIELSPSTRMRFVDAGHILGSAMVALTIRQDGHDWKITFTGDIGRRGLPYLKDPSPVPYGDLLICESTYGGRTHETVAQMAKKLSEVVQRTVQRGGKILVPAFSLGRTQIVVHYFQQWMREGLLPTLPIYVDSPLASEVAKVYSRYRESFQGLPLDDEPKVHYVGTPEESREVSMRPGPCVLIASGGMCEGGRILQHLRQHIDDPRATIILVSYQAPLSVGHQLLEKRPTVRFHGKNWNKWAEVVELNGFSGHADHNDFLALLGPLAGQTRHVRLVHGEPEQAGILAAALRLRGFEDVEIPAREDAVSVA